MTATVLLLSSACASAPDPCPGWGQPVSSGTVGREDVTEASGLVASRAQGDLLWTHNDRGGLPVLYALGADGRDRGAMTLAGVDAVDWEDLAIGVDAQGAPALFVGDIGDNDQVRSSVTVWRIAEPSVLDRDQVVEGAEALRLTWPDGALNAEGLAIDPRTNDLLVATKEKRRVRIFSAQALADAGSSQVLEELAEFDLSSGAFKGGRRVTSMDLSPTGDRIFLRTRRHVLVFERGEDDTVADAIAAGPCLAPAPEESDGEALAARMDGFWTVSEGVRPTLWSVAAP